MPEFSVANLPEIFVSDTAISKQVSEAVERGQLRKLASRLYTRNLNEDPVKLVRRNWYYLISGYYPNALIADRTALENQPAEDGSVFLISDKKRDTELPGLAFRPRKGAGPLDSDKPFVGGARLAGAWRTSSDDVDSVRSVVRVRTTCAHKLQSALETLGGESYVPVSIRQLSLTIVA